MSSLGAKSLASSSSCSLFLYLSQPEPDRTPVITPEREVTRRPDSPFYPPLIPGTPDSTTSPDMTRHTWPATRSEEWQRIVAHEAITSMTNAQKKAHHWKVERCENNKITQAQLNHDIEITLQYVDNSTQTTPHRLHHGSVPIIPTAYNHLRLTEQHLQKHAVERSNDFNDRTSFATALFPLRSQTMRGTETDSPVYPVIPS